MWPAVGYINGLVALTGYSDKKMYGCFAGTKKVYERGSAVNTLPVNGQSTTPSNFNTFKFVQYLDLMHAHKLSLRL